jgi:fructoselysine 6-phosphate deglycase
MLELDKSTVDFLVTENMVKEVEEVFKRDVPKVKIFVDKMISRGIERIYFVACGSPLCAGQTAKLLFDQYSIIQSEAYSGWEFLDNPPFNLNNRCAVIGISDSGKTEEVVKSIEMANSCGALTLAITKEAENPIASVGEYFIAYEGECIWEIHLSILYTLVLNMIQETQPNPEVDDILMDMKKLPDVLENLVVNYEEKGRILGEKASKWPMIYTVAAGLLRPLAYKEGIISLMEFTWTHGSAIESGEFRHGPLEIVEKGVPFIFLLGTDNSRHTTERAINFVKRYADDYIIIDHKEIGQGLHPALAPFTLFVPMEWFSYYLALYKDHNPDDRRYYGGIVEY